MSPDDLRDPLFEYKDSKDAVKGIINGFRAAMEVTEEAEDSVITQHRHSDKLANKLLHPGVVWADIDVQRSWHLYGVDYGNDAPSPSIFTAAAIETIESPESPIVDSAEYEYPTVREVKEFYLNLEIGALDGLGEIFTTIDEDFFTFLSEFYEEYAPTEYRDLYQYNVEIQRRLEFDSKEANIGTIDFGARRELGRVISNLHQELANDPLFDEVTPHFISFTDLLEDLYRGFEVTDDPFEFERPPEAGIRQLDEFYHNYAWEWVAELISGETAKGLEAGEIEDTVETKELPTVRARFEDELRKKQNLLQEWGMLPEGRDTFTRPEFGEMDELMADISPDEMETVDER